MGKKDPPMPIRKACTSVACTHTNSGHCGVVACGNYKGDCPVHG
jgi:hypothetical protein